MEEIHFFQTGFAQVPDSLDVRSESATYLLGIITAMSFIFLALAVKSNEKIVRGLPRIFMISTQTENKLKETMRLGSFSSLLLILNFISTFGVCTYLMLDTFTEIPLMVQIGLALLIPVGLLIVQTAPVFLVRFLTGDNIPLISISGNTLTGYQLGSAILGIIATIWILNPEYSFIAFIGFCVIFGILQIARLLKNTYLLLSTGTPWYYLMLYLCSLEILPLFVAYYYVSTNFRS